MLGVPRAHKARYTPATELNSTWLTLLKVDVKSTVAETGNKSATKSTVADTFNCVADKVDVVADKVDVVASVYGAKATRSTWLTFNKVDRVEFNFVASVYRLKSVSTQSLHVSYHLPVGFLRVCRVQLGRLKSRLYTL